MEALSFYEKSLPFYEETKYSMGMANTLNNIGLTYRHLKNYNKAMQNLTKSLNINNKIGNKRGISISYLHLGDVFL